MEIKGKVHCFFEQSGTFKREFIKLGIPAEDYDIQNNFGETDHTDDLFVEIDKAFDDEPSLFDNISSSDLIFAFFPCIYFSCLSQIEFGWYAKVHRRKTVKEKAEAIIDRSAHRERYLQLLIKLFAIVEKRSLRLIVENPWSMQTFLKTGFIMQPSFVDKDRTRRGDYFKKPTAYWFWQCEPTYGQSYQKNKEVKRVIWGPKQGKKGMCSEERSMISPDYARNFICDFILGKEQEQLGKQISLF